MKQVLALFLICITLLGGCANHQAKPDGAEQLSRLINTLTELTNMGEACGEHMNYFGKKALQGAVCKEFKNAFYEHWPSRKALQLEIIDHKRRQDLGLYSCSQCQQMLKQAEELRTFVTYYLDYMDFWNEL